MLIILPDIVLLFTLIELMIVIAIIAIIAAIALPAIAKAIRAPNCIKLAEEIKKELEDAKDYAEKLYKGESGVNDTTLNKKLDNLTNKITRLTEHCKEKDNSIVASEINTLLAQLKLYMQGDSSPAEKPILDTFINTLVDLAKKITK